MSCFIHRPWWAPGMEVALYTVASPMTMSPSVLNSSGQSSGGSRSRISAPLREARAWTGESSLVPQSVGRREDLGQPGRRRRGVAVEDAVQDMVRDRGRDAAAVP